MKSLRILGIVFSVVILASCKKDVKLVKEPLPAISSVAFQIDIYDSNSKMVQKDDTVALQNGNDFYFSLFKLYVSKLTVVDSSGAEFLLKDVALINPLNFSENGFYFELPDGYYKSLKVGFGVDSMQNAQDPGSFDRGHPLSSYQSMYWDMLKYRFAKFEGSIFENGQNGDPLAYHPGTDPLYQVREFPIDFQMLNDQFSSYSFSLQIDINKIFNGPGGTIDLSAELQTHSISSDIGIAEKFMQNLAAAGDLQILTAVQ